MRHHIMLPIGRTLDVAGRYMQAEKKSQPTRAKSAIAHIALISNP